MLLCIGSEFEMSKFPEWEKLKVDDLYPSQIRKVIHEIITSELSSENQSMHFTLNRTVLDEVGNANSAGCPIHYSEVFVFVNGKIIPLLSIKNEAWLSHFTLGDVFNQEKL